MRDGAKACTKGLTEMSQDLVASSTEEYTDQGGVGETLSWLEAHRQQASCVVDLIPLRDLEGWQFDDHMNLRHVTGKFFSIEGLHVSTNVGSVHEWSQPIINQPEIGILGILCQKRGGVLQFLLQAKIEPGNVGYVQLSPTLQATKSNYTRVHQGRLPAFLEYFEDPPREWILFDQLQSEQGGRFYKKRNRNVLLVIPPDENLEIPDTFRWMTLGQIKRLISSDNVVNMDTRTVLSCISLGTSGDTTGRVQIGPGGSIEDWRIQLYDSLLQRECGLHSIEVILAHLTGLKTRAFLEVEKCGIDGLRDWVVRDYEIAHREDRFFKVVGARIHIECREVQCWCQPLVQPRHHGLVGYLIRRIDGVYHLLVQAKLEPGNFDALELAPTVQCITGNYRRPTYDIPYVDWFLSPKSGRILFDSHQSEEGGRFFQEENRYVVVEVGDEFPVDVDPRYVWMTLGQAKLLVRFNNYFNVEARSLLACFSPI